VVDLKASIAAVGFVSPVAKGVMPATKNRETTQRPPCGRTSVSSFPNRKERQREMLDKLVVFVLSLKAKLSSERGQDIMEYAILTGGIAIALVVALALFTGALNGWFSAMGDFFGSISPQ
jgi:Flp pilus assembly pilin Flp